jgi:hypothetical protein
VLVGVAFCVLKKGQELGATNQLAGYRSVRYLSRAPLYFVTPQTESHCIALSWESHIIAHYRDSRLSQLDVAHMWNPLSFRALDFPLLL